MLSSCRRHIYCQLMSVVQSSTRTDPPAHTASDNINNINHVASYKPTNLLQIILKVGQHVDNV